MERDDISIGIPDKLANLYEEGCKLFEKIESEKKHQSLNAELERINNWIGFWKRVYKLFPAEVKEFIVIFGLNEDDKHYFTYDPKIIDIKIPGHCPITAIVTGDGSNLMNREGGTSFWVYPEYSTNFPDWEQQDIPEERFYFQCIQPRTFINFAPAIYFARRRWLEVFKGTAHLRTKSTDKQSEPEIDRTQKNEPVYEVFEDDFRSTELFDVFSETGYEKLVQLIRTIIREEM